MTDPMASKGVDRAVARVLSQVAAAAPVTPAAPPTRVATGTDAVALSGVAQTFAAQASLGPPVDADRIQQIKKAVANGTFPILPATIADRMLALRYDWLSRDAQ
ncbi:flagellar biosynthesis anti-sigma factor FlgM [Sphingomonas sp.]|uniref:flagellar biosynthesis anti-sigma factor FlgM n=1 Tax=Sphingomonas sp. TaxID=28214 RepID=UPI003CC61C32